MNRKFALISTAIVALVSSAAFAAEQENATVASGETHDQMCARWAGYQNLQGSAQKEYINDCKLDLRVPDKSADSGDD